MNNVNKKLKLILVVGMITVPTILMAQDSLDVNDANVPFDGGGGIALLVAAGIGYGLKKVYDKKKAGKNTAVIEE